MDIVSTDLLFILSIFVKTDVYAVCQIWYLGAFLKGDGKKGSNAKMIKRENMISF